jgi:hypothetical protein
MWPGTWRSGTATAGGSVTRQLFLIASSRLWKAFKKEKSLKLKLEDAESWERGVDNTIKGLRNCVCLSTKMPSTPKPVELSDFDERW